MNYLYFEVNEHLEFFESRLRLETYRDAAIHDEVQEGQHSAFVSLVRLDRS